MIVAYQAPYVDPIKAQTGDRVLIDFDKKSEIAGWLWCINCKEKRGWVPESYLDIKGNRGTLRCDYDAIELTIKIGDLLTVLKAESGFLWVTNEHGQQGWIPSTHVAPVTS